MKINNNNNNNNNIQEGGGNNCVQGGNFYQLGDEYKVNNNCDMSRSRQLPPTIVTVPWASCHEEQ